MQERRPVIMVCWCVCHCLLYDSCNMVPKHVQPSWSCHWRFCLFFPPDDGLKATQMNPHILLTSSVNDTDLVMPYLRLLEDSGR